MALIMAVQAGFALVSIRPELFCMAKEGVPDIVNVDLYRLWPKMGKSDHCGSSRLSGNSDLTVSIMLQDLLTLVGSPPKLLIFA